jgi:hypothetical protein
MSNEMDLINDLPEEILSVIMNHSCQTPKDYMEFKRINRRSSLIVGNLEHLFINDENQYSEELDELCRRYTSLKTFDWYFKNDITFTLKNVKRIIINNRGDVLQHGLKYPHFLELLFNRFYMNVDSQNDIFSIVESLNPLIVAAENNHIFIVKLLIEKNEISNPYIRLIPELLEISIKYNHKNLLNYLICNHIELVEKKISDKLISIIYRIENCEDILFHLVVNNRVKIESKHLQGLVTKHYNQLFKYIYNHMGWIQTSITFKMNLLSGCLSSNNIDGFTILFEEIKDLITRKEIAKLLFGNRNEDFYNGKTEIIYHLVNNYLNYIDNDSGLLRNCIMNDIEENTMVQLVGDGFHFKEEDMKVVLENNQFRLLEKMCQMKCMTSVVKIR